MDRPESKTKDELRRSIRQITLWRHIPDDITILQVLATSFNHTFTVFEVSAGRCTGLLHLQSNPAVPPVEASPK